MPAPTLHPQPAAGPTRAGRAAGLPREARRDAIVEAVLPLVLEHGSAITSRQIAEAAGIAEGTIFRAFADKDDLLDAVVARALDRAPLEARLAEIDADQPLEGRLTEAVTILQTRTAEVWRIISAVGLNRTADQRDDARRRNLAELPPLVALFVPERDRLRVEPADAARRLRALAIAGSHPSLIDQPLAADEIVAMLLDGIRRHDAEADAR